MTSPGYLDLLRVATPEVIVVVTALVVLAADLAALQGVALRIRLGVCVMVASVGCALAIVWMLPLPQSVDLFDGMMVVDPVTQIVKITLLLLAIFSMVLSLGAEFTTHVGEYFALMLLAAVGMMFLVSAEDILMVFVSLELTSLSLYILAAFNKRSAASAEAALKYFLFGGMSAAFTLFGMSLLYGLSGATNLSQIAAAVQRPGFDPLLSLAIVMTLVGFGFKVAAVPFHLWAPDAYEGAPIPSAAWIASGSKVAGFVILAKVLLVGFAGAEGSGAWAAYVPGWVPILAVMASASMILGNLAAIVQIRVRRLLAYSAIAHAGYMLLGVLPHSPVGLAALLYYVATYGLTTVGAFGVVALVQARAGDDRLTDFAGLSRQAPLVSLCLMIFMLSLAGIPPLAGFFGKFYLFVSVAAAGPGNLGLLWLVVLAVAASAVSLYYYLQVLKQVYVAEPSPALGSLRVPVCQQVAIGLLALAVLLLGCMPGPVVEQLAAMIRVAGF